MDSEANSSPVEIKMTQNWKSCEIQARRENMYLENSNIQTVGLFIFWKKEYDERENNIILRKL